MNRFVSFLPVGLVLATVGLAQPAQAQYVKGVAYRKSRNAPPFKAGDIRLGI